MNYKTPTFRAGIFEHFDTGGRYWTPSWDAVNQQGRTVKRVLMQDGSWHEFDEFVSRAEATTFMLTGKTGSEPSPPIQA